LQASDLTSNNLTSTNLSLIQVWNLPLSSWSNLSG